MALEELSPRLERIRAKMQSIEQEYTLLEAEKQRAQQQLQLIEQFVTFQAKFVMRLDRLTFAEKKQVVRLLVEEVLVDSVNESLMVKHVIPLDKRFPLRSGSNHPSPGQNIPHELDKYMESNYLNIPQWARSQRRKQG